MSGSTPKAATRTYNGLNDKVPLAIAGTLKSSLILVHVAEVELRVFAPWEAFGNSKRRVQARFVHAGANYRLWVTDPGYERAYLAQADRTYGLGECYLTVSLGEPFGDDCHKLIAAIIERKDVAGPA